MPTSQRKAKLQSAAFKRTRADHSSELAEDYVELIADLIDEKGEARGTDVALRLGVANATVVKMLKKLMERGLGDARTLPRHHADGRRLGPG